ncbi:MAG: hypothetical protein ACN4GM_13290 [Gammaproteobacteria bacterium]
MSEVKEVYFGVGSAYIREVGAAAGLRSLGEVDQFDLAYNQTAIDLPNNQTLGGGILDTVYRIDSMEVAIKMRNFSSENFALSEFGGFSAVVGAAITDEVSPMHAGTFIPTLYPGITLVSVNDAALSAGTILTEGTDYEVRSGGIYVLDTYTGVEGADGYISYTHPSVDVIQALIDSGKEYEIFLDGMNEALSGDPFTHNLFKVKMSPAQTLSLLGGGAYGEMAVTGKVLSDSTKTGLGISKYMKSVKKTAA